MGPQGLEAGDTLYGHPVDVDGIMCVSSRLLEVQYELLGLAGAITHEHTVDPHSVEPSYPIPIMFATV